MISVKYPPENVPYPYTTPQWRVDIKQSLDNLFKNQSIWVADSDVPDDKAHSRSWYIMSCFISGKVFWLDKEEKDGKPGTRIWRVD